MLTLLPHNPPFLLNQYCPISPLAFNLYPLIPDGSVIRKLPANERDAGRPWFDPWVKKIHLEYEMAINSSILAWRTPMDRRAWWAMAHGVTKRRTWLNTQRQTHTHTYIWSLEPCDHIFFLTHASFCLRILFLPYLSLRIPVDLLEIDFQDYLLVNLGQAISGGAQISLFLTSALGDS